MATLLKWVGGGWAVLGLANLVLMPWTTAGQGLLIAGLMFNVLLFVVPGLIVYGIGVAITKKQEAPAAPTEPKKSVEARCDIEIGDDSIRSISAGSKSFNICPKCGGPVSIIQEDASQCEIKKNSFSKYLLIFTAIAVISIVFVFLKGGVNGGAGLNGKKGWLDYYMDSSDFLKEKKMSKAAYSYYQAQLSSSWCKELRPSAFVHDGTDPGTLRAAINVGVGQLINPWAFQDPKGRIFPILTRIEKEISELKTLDDLENSPYSGRMEKKESRKDIEKYPFVIAPENRLQRFKSFANNWIQQGKHAANR